MSSGELDTSKIKEWRSIITLIVFVITNIVVIFPFDIPIPVPRSFWFAYLDSLSALRIIPPRRTSPRKDTISKDAFSKEINSKDVKDEERRRWPKRWMPDEREDRRTKWLWFPVNFVTGPLIADLFLLAIIAIGRKEVYDGTVGARHIFPLEIMAFFLTLAYIAISIDASGLIRWLAFKVLQKAGHKGHLLYFYLYTFFFSLASFIGNDPIVLSGTAFLAYMTRVSSNIRDPKAWIFTQFSVANVASAILVSSNPTNLVLAGAFGIQFIEYTANMIVPVIVTAILLFPFLLYYIFPDENLLPRKIEMHELPAGERKTPINPNIPFATGVPEEDQNADTDESKLLSLEEVMNPFLDKRGAWFGAIIMAVTLIAILVINAADPKTHPAFWVTAPAAAIMLCWDLQYGWRHRHETRKIAREGRREVEDRRQRTRRESLFPQGTAEETRRGPSDEDDTNSADHDPVTDEPHATSGAKMDASSAEDEKSASTVDDQRLAAKEGGMVKSEEGLAVAHSASIPSPAGLSGASSNDYITEKAEAKSPDSQKQTTLQSLIADGWRWSQETFPTVTAVLGHLPIPLVPFGLCMFVLVQALVTKGWIAVFAYGWSHWVKKTGTVGAIGGMGFLGVILCNCAGTNIGTAILLCRVIQEWILIHKANHDPLTQRTFWATVYAMAIGVNYGAFSTCFSASLAGLLWRDILARKDIKVKALDFALVNFRIIAFTMVIGLTVLIGEVYITRNTEPYKGKG